MIVSTSTVLSAVLLLIAGAYQFTPLKRVCLGTCRTPLGFLLGDWKPGLMGAFRIERPELNRFLAEALDARQPPQKQGHRLKLLYIAQIETRPPRFALQVNNRNKMTRDYAYYLENRLRSRFGLDGVPVIIDVRERKQRRSERG